MISRYLKVEYYNELFLHGVMFDLLSVSEILFYCKPFGFFLANRKVYVL